MTEHISKKSRTATTFPISNPRTMKDLLNPSNIHDTLPVIQSFLRSINFAFACKFFYRIYREDLLYSAKDLIETHVIQDNFSWHSREISKCLKILGIIPSQETIPREKDVNYKDMAISSIISLMNQIIEMRKRHIPYMIADDLYSYDPNKFAHIINCVTSHPSINFAFSRKFFYKIHLKDLLYSAKDLIEYHVIRYNFPWHSREISKCLKILEIIPSQETILREESVNYEDMTIFFIISLINQIMKMRKRHIPNIEIDSYDPSKFAYIVNCVTSHPLENFYNNFLKSPSEKRKTASEIRSLTINKNITLPKENLPRIPIPKELRAILGENSKLTVLSIINSFPDHSYNIDNVFDHNESGSFEDTTDSERRKDDIFSTRFINAFLFEEKFDLIFELQEGTVLLPATLGDIYNDDYTKINWLSSYNCSWIEDFYYFIENDFSFLITPIIYEHLPILDLIHEILRHPLHSDSYPSEFSKIVILDEIRGLMSKGILTLEELLSYTKNKDNPLIINLDFTLDVIKKLLSNYYERILEGEITFKKAFDNTSIIYDIQLTF